MNISKRKRKAIKKMENKNINPHLSSEYLEYASDKSVEKMAELFINFFENIEHNENKNKS